MNGGVEMGDFEGVDISRWQKGIKIGDLKNAGYQFAILRGGYTGYGDLQKYKDECFEDFYSQSRRINFPVGVYYYSCASTENKGIEEANFLYENCLKGKIFEFPVYIDVEDDHRPLKDKKSLTDAIIAFCETLEEKGYFVGVYASLSWFTNHIETSRLYPYTKWVACWKKEIPYFRWHAFDMWQYSSKGKLDKFTIDLNYSFRDFPSIIQGARLNGYSSSPKRITYRVKEGDTLWAISKKYLGDGARYPEIKSLNNLKDDLIKVGQKLMIDA